MCRKSVVKLDLDRLLASRVHLYADSNIDAWWRTYASVNWVIIASGNGLSPVKRQAITLAYADL